MTNEEILTLLEDSVDGFSTLLIEEEPVTPDTVFRDPHTTKSYTEQGKLAGFTTDWGISKNTFVIAAEDTFFIRIEDDEFDRLVTIGDLLTLIATKRQERLIAGYQPWRPILGGIYAPHAGIVVQSRPPGFYIDRNDVVCVLQVAHFERPVRSHLNHGRIVRHRTRVGQRVHRGDILAVIRPMEGFKLAPGEELLYAPS